MTKFKIFIFSISLFFSYSNIFSQNVGNSSNSSKKITIYGYVKEQGSQELLTGVNIYIPQLKTGTITNTYGFYSISLSISDSISIIASFVGYTPCKFDIFPDNKYELNFNLSPNLVLDEVTIVANKNTHQAENVNMSTINIPVAQIKNIPSLLGEKDVLKVIQLMPGVKKGMEGTSGFYVRGGGPDQNLIILDDAIVYNVSHIFGFFSVFNGDAIKSVELTKGGFPARYGSRLSSVLDITMKEGNKTEWHSEGGIGLVASRLVIEGPLKKNKSSILLSGRRSYIDALMQPLFSGDEKAGYYFYDLNTKINYDFGNKNKVYLSGYFGRDKFYTKYKSDKSDEKAAFYWGNATATLRWNHLYNSQLFSNTSLVYSRYKFGIYDKMKDYSNNNNFSVEYFSGIEDIGFKHDFDFLPNSKHWIKTGVLVTRHRYKPYVYAKEDNSNFEYRQKSKKITGLESCFYLEDIYQPFSNLKINPGIRISHFLADKEQYFDLEPRISASWRIIKDFAWKASYAHMNQYIHLLSNTGISLPTDLWVPATDRIKPQRSKQIATGFVKDLPNKNITLTIEGYYKTMQNIIGYKPGAFFLDIYDPESANEMTWEDNVTSGKGWSYGMEFLLQRQFGKLSGWVGYTLSWTQLQFDSINFGRKYYAKYDRRHDISLVGIYKLTEKITFSATWIYSTGNSIDLPVSKYQLNSNPNTSPLPLIGDYNYSYSDFNGKNNSRMEPYHRLDIGIQFHKKRKNRERIWEISLYNVYNRKNPFYYYTSEKDINGVQYNKMYKGCLFPFIPSITYSFKF